MAGSAIDPERLKTSRKARKIGRPRLARMSGLTERQLAKLESNQALGLTAAKAARLSCTLNVPVLALTGELPLISDDLETMASQTCTNGCCG